MSSLLLGMPLWLGVIFAVSMMLFIAFAKASTQTLNALTMGMVTVMLAFALPYVGIDFRVVLFGDIFAQMLVMDSFGHLFVTLFLFGTLLTLAISNRYIVTHPFFRGEFFTLILFALVGMMLLATSVELISAYIALEIAALSVYILIGMHRSDARSSEAFFKYLVQGSFAGTFFLMGAMLLYLQTGSTHIEEIARYIASHPSSEMPLVIVGGALLMVTLFFKLGAFWFHTWVLDVYAGSAMPIMMFMAATFKIAIFALSLRLFIVDFLPLVAYYEEILIVTALLTMVGGSLLSLRQTSLKRLLAASSIVHSGYILMALAAMHGAPQESARAIIFYLIAYFLSGVGSLGVLSLLKAYHHDYDTIDSFRGLGATHPLLAASFTIFLLSLAGFPSTIGFLGKFYLFSATIAAGHYALAGVGLFVAFVSIAYYFRVVAALYFYAPSVPSMRFALTLTPVVIFVIALATVWGGIGTALIEANIGADGIIDWVTIALNSL
ncbi:MAG: hypothetical protein KU37_04515 [Sulfuricurvum sp. PC08-66]|nr:MAG: hypothetical protein KU37_04515 [Sulfuricurvum sp. PC08-66]